MQTSFFNTTGQTGEDLVKSNDKSLNQNELILKVFKEFSNNKFTPFDILYNIQRIYGRDFPITSVRRGITTLTEQGLLVKSDKAESKGIYKVPNHSWKLNTG
jgi:hypothetical protein